MPSRRDREWWRSRAGFQDFGLEPDEPNAPLLWNWEDLYKDLSAFLEVPVLRQIDPPAHRLILSHLVAGLLEEKGPGLLNLWPGLARPGFIDVLSDDIHELINEAISPGQFSITADEEKPTSRVLPELYERYIAYLQQHDLLDSSQIPVKTLTLLESDASSTWARNRAFVFTGFMSFTHGQLALLRKLEEVCFDVIVLKPATELQDFQDATTQLEGHREDPPLAPGRVAALVAPEHSLEPETVARALALWHAGEGFLSCSSDTPVPFPGFGAIGISTPSQRLTAMETALRRYHIPYSLARGQSVSQTLLGTTLGPLWAAWVQGLEPGETALLLAQPCLAGSGFPIDEAVQTGPWGAKGWATWLSKREKNASNLEEKKDAKRAVKAFKALVRFCRAVERGAPLSGIFKTLYEFLIVPGLWVDALTELFADLDGSLRELAASVAEVGDKYLALRELQPDLGPAGRAVIKGAEAVDFLKSWTQETLVRPAPPLGGAVVLHTGPPPVLTSYPVWVMTDVTQKNWPGLIRTSPLLDTPEREALRVESAYLPSVHDKHVQKEALFRRLLQTGELLTVVSRSVTDEEGRPVGPSSFMGSFIEDMKLWEYSETPAGEPGGWFPAIEAGAAEKSGRSMPAIQAPPARLQLPVSALHELLDCPFRYWLRRNVKLRERDTSLFSAAEAGLLTHKIWETAWRRLEEGETLPRLAAEEWEKALTLEGDYSKFRRLLEDKRLARHVKNIGFYVPRLAQTQQATLERLAASGLRHSQVLTETELPPYEMDGVTFTGRCDRVEIFEGELAVIVDYKWGKSASYEKKFDDLALRPYLSTSSEVFRYGLQLSAYALMYADGKSNLRVAGVGFLGHGDGKLAGTFESPVAESYLPGKKNAIFLKERAEEAREAMRCAAFILKSGRFEPCYAADSCSWCDMKGLCRRGEFRGEVLANKEALN
ncbi:MAG: PD-(D/E)XK nuclease family protein [Synergistaceae bacterium]|nr:PD-(D/E)XK nuclease family protein [Synergistaceae bacterium]